jgi:hypothetical protein
MPKFRLKSIVNNLEDVPEAYRDRYVERDGKYSFDEIEIDDFAEVQSALENERQGRQADKASVEALMTEIVKIKALNSGVLPEDIDDVMKITRKRFDLRNDKIVVLDQEGNETTISPDSFFSEVFKTMKPKFYAASTAEGNQLDRAAFDQMAPQKQMEFMKGGGVISDGAPADSARDTGGSAAGKKQVQRAAFDKMPPPEQMAAVKSGVQIVD